MPEHTVRSAPSDQNDRPDPVDRSNRVDRPSPVGRPDRTDILVSRAESGRKLLQFLEHRLNLPPTLLHRWIRTGQVRLNSGRCKPFIRVNAGDTVRLPPFALRMAAQSTAGHGPAPESGAESGAASAPTSGPTSGSVLGRQAALPPLPPLVDSCGDILAFHKPAGLPTHPGTGHYDSLSARLAAAHVDAPFTPTPVHRLDKDTSGILLTAATFAALRQVQEWLHERSVGKEYIAWVHGSWPYADARLLHDQLIKSVQDGYEKVRALPQAPFGEAAEDSRVKEALCLVRPLLVRARESLLLIRLFTGRTHQIRVQLARRGHPVLGDAKYGLRDNLGRMYLHSLRITLPDGRSFACLPDWDAGRALAEMPAVAPLNADAHC